MTRAQAEEILLLHRRDSGAADNPELAEALRLAAADPELGQSLEKHLEFQASMVKQLRAIEPPSDLKARILASVTSVDPAAPTPAPMEGGWRFKRRHLLAVAASIILLIVAGDFWLARNREDAPTFDNFRSRMSSFAVRTYQMDVVTNNQAAVRQYLASHGAPADFKLTPALEKLPVKGGGRLSWQNQPVAMMCFALTNNQTAFMFVVDQNAIQQQPAKMEMASTRSFSSVAWKKDGKIYLLAADERPEALANLAP